MIFRILIKVLFFSLINESISQTDGCLQNLDNPDFNTISQELGTETITREYILKIPANYDENVASPLIINMHGFGDCAAGYSETIGEFYNFAQLAHEENIIVAYPQGAYRPEKEDTYWEPGDNGVQNIFENDVYFIEELIRNIESNYNIDSMNIFACGYSNGGMMSYSLACNRSNLFSAIGIMSGTMLQEECSLEKPIPIIKFHGIDDGILPYNGNIWYQSVNEVVNFWLDQNEIPNNNVNSAQLNGGKVIQDHYFGGNENSCLSLFTINEEFDKPGDHVWFSEEIEGLNPNRIMWNFFTDNCNFVNSTQQISRKEIALFPNPVKEELKILNAMNQDFSIYSLSGKLELKGKIYSNQETIHLPYFQKGYYIIRIEKYAYKFIKI